MKSGTLFFVCIMFVVPLFGADASFPGLEMLVATSRWNVDDMAVGTNGETDLVVWASSNRLYGVRVAASGDVIDKSPLQLGGFASNPSVASDGTRFVVMWTEGPGEPGRPLSFWLSVVEPRGDPAPAVAIVANADRRSRPRIAYGAGRFAFGWRLYSEDVTTAPPPGRLSFLEVLSTGASVESFPAPFEYNAYPIEVVPTAEGAVAVSYAQVLIPSTGNCGIPPCIGLWWGPRYRELEIREGAAVPVSVSAPVAALVSGVALARTAGQSMLMWAADESVRQGADTIRRMWARDGETPDPAAAEVLFSSPGAAIESLSAAVSPSGLWLAWIDRMIDYEPRMDPTAFCEVVTAEGEKTVYPLMQNASLVDLASSRGRVVFAVYVPSAIGGRLLLERISEPARSRAVRR